MDVGRFIGYFYGEKNVFYFFRDFQRMIELNGIGKAMKRLDEKVGEYFWNFGEGKEYLSRI